MTSRCNVYVETESLVVEIEMPGVSARDVRLTLLERHIEVYGTWAAPRADRYSRRERPIGEFRRSIPLPRPIDVEASDAPNLRFDRGVLRIELRLRKASERRTSLENASPVGLRVVSSRAPRDDSAPHAALEVKSPKAQVHNPRNIDRVPFGQSV